MSHQEKEEQMPFEEALKDLETLVQAMEQGEVPLADLISQYEKGKKLLNVCQSHLKTAELKIEALNEEGSLDQFDH